MITLEQYVGVHYNSLDWTPERKKNAQRLLDVANRMCEHMANTGVNFPYNPKTRSQISGDTLGGFRPQSCLVGAPSSSHKDALAVDWYDPNEEIDNFILAKPDILRTYGVYIEHPDKTRGWSHWTIKAPKSGKRIFYP